MMKRYLLSLNPNEWKAVINALSQYADGDMTVEGRRVRGVCDRMASDWPESDAAREHFAAMQHTERWQRLHGIADQRRVSR